MNSIKNQKKILIVSESNNNVVKRILFWLLNTDYKLIKLNAEIDEFSIVKFDVENSFFLFRINDKVYNSKDFRKMYFHRGAIQIQDITGVRLFQESVKDFKSAFNYYRTAYEVSIREIVSNVMHSDITIGADNGGRINKVKMLEIARASGLKIPKTLLTTRKSDLFSFLKENNKVITKSLDLNFIYYDSEIEKLLHGLTCEITEDDLQDLPESFPLTIFQENLDKLVELRIFFIGKDNYSSAIFSQYSQQTKQDYRNYDEEFPNRVVPFTLTKDLSEKINLFKQMSNLKTGSIDIILTQTNEYYFLEVNPQGQFLGVSDFCNYYLEKKLSDYIIT